jgi:hypothetical protein
VAISYRQLRCTPSILILVLSVALLVLFCTPTAASFGIRLSYISSASTTQHRKHSSPLVVEVCYHAVTYIQRWMSFIAVYCCTHYQATGCLRRICLRGTCLSSRCLALSRYVTLFYWCLKFSTYIQRKHFIK